MGQQNEGFPTVVSSGLCGPRSFAPLYVLRGASRKRGGEGCGARLQALRWSPDTARQEDRREAMSTAAPPESTGGQAFSPERTGATTTDLLQGCAQFAGGLRDRERLRGPGGVL